MILHSSKIEAIEKSSLVCMCLSYLITHYSTFTT